MAKIENFECVKNEQGSIEKVLMTIGEGNERQEAEVYLAFADNNTDKRYLMYTTDVKTNENEKITFSLSTLSLQGENYVLEETNNLEYSNIQLPIINIVGLNNQKDAEEVMNMIEEKFGKGNISIIDLTMLERNVSNITVAEKPARKANVPVVIANGIKRFYLNRLNKLLKEIYSAEEMTPEQADLANEQLDKIVDKLDELSADYLGRNQTASVEKSLNEIENAKVDIEQARNRIENMTTMEEPESVEENNLQEENQVPEETSENLEATKEESEVELPPVSIQVVTKDLDSKESTVHNTSEVEEEPVQVEQPTNVSVTEPQYDEEKLNEQVNEVIGTAIDELAKSFSVATQKIADGISNLYREEVKRLMTQHAEESTLLTNSLNEATSKLKEYGDKLKNQDVTIETLTTNNEQLQKQNSDLQETVTAKDEQLNQQNGMIESFREEIKSTKEASSTREQELLGEIEKLKAENSSLVSYKQNYERIASMIGGQMVSQPTVEQNPSNSMSQQEIEEAVDHVLNTTLGEESTGKTL